MTWIVLAVGSEQGTGVNLFAGEAAFQHRGGSVSSSAVPLSQGNMERADVAPCHVRACANTVLDLFPDVFKCRQESTDLGPLPTTEERPDGKCDGCIKMHHRLARPKPCQSFTHDLNTTG